MKKLEELSASELRTELKRVGIKGKFVKAQAIVRLKTHLVDISEDPLTFEFDPDVPVAEASEDNPEDYVVMNDGNDNAGVTRSEAASISGLVGAINASTTTPLSLPLSYTPFVSTSSASISPPFLTSGIGVFIICISPFIKSCINCFILFLSSYFFLFLKIHKTCIHAFS